MRKFERYAKGIVDGWRSKESSENMEELQNLYKESIAQMKKENEQKKEEAQRKQTEERAALRALDEGTKIRKHFEDLKNHQG